RGSSADAGQSSTRPRASSSPATYLGERMSVTSTHEAIRLICSQHASIQALTTLCRSHSLRLFVVGGALRDLMLDHPIGRDIDVYIEGPEAQRTAVLQKVTTLPVTDGPAVEVKGCGSVERAVRQFDFTVNTLIYDVLADTIWSPMGGIDDLRERRIRPNYDLLFTASPAAFSRAFRIAITRRLKL